ncbi:hypothetical protein MCEMSE15_01812 [Fimbriimonadaceae bacterium]
MKTLALPGMKLGLVVCCVGITGLFLPYAPEAYRYWAWALLVGLVGWAAWSRWDAIRGDAMLNQVFGLVALGLGLVAVRFFYDPSFLMQKPLGSWAMFASMIAWRELVVESRNRYIAAYGATEGNDPWWRS